MNPWHAPPQYMTTHTLLQAPEEVPAKRSEADVQWVVGWIRDILVIAMSVGNLLHLAGA